MKMYLLISVVLLSSIFSACGTINRADSERMLDRRAEYADDENSKLLQNPTLKEGGVDGFKDKPVPVRTRPTVAAIWIHPHETASRDYFWGGWMSTVTEQDQWVLSKPGLTPKAPAIKEIGTVPTNTNKK